MPQSVGERGGGEEERQERRREKKRRREEGLEVEGKHLLRCDALPLHRKLKRVMAMAENVNRRVDTQERNNPSRGIEAVEVVYLFVTESSVEK